MKLICDPKNWREPIEIDDVQCKLLQTVAGRLGLIFNWDKSQDKVYLGNLTSKPQTDPAPEPVAHFVLKLPTTPASSIIDGCLMLEGQTYKACSGLPGYQVFGDYYNRYCSIPPGEYKLDLAWYNCDTVGIEGPYYHILPDPIVDPAGSGRQRSEIGLHRDANTPGTAGCIGIVGQDWTRLHTALQAFAKVRKYLKLVVTYKCQD